MLRRIHLDRVQLGEVALSPAEAHHVRDVLRLKSGQAVEVFDDAGRLGSGVIGSSDAREVVAHIERIDSDAPEMDFQWSIAAAIPKGNRADWMIEKLSELGAAAYIPLLTERSVVTAEGRSKLERWNRLAAEAAKQSRRRGVMRVDVPTPLSGLMDNVRSAEASVAWFFSTEPDARSASDVIDDLIQLDPATRPRHLTLLIGPEGGWTEGEIARFTSAGLTPVKLTATILRIETAAVAAAAIVGTMLAPRIGQQGST